jgi:hypothetical protein
MPEIILYIMVAGTALILAQMPNSGVQQQAKPLEYHWEIAPNGQPTQIQNGYHFVASKDGKRHWLEQDKAKP